MDLKLSFLTFSVTGKYLRRNPIARAGFIFYLLLIHIWTFVLLFFHAHSFETTHADFGAGAGVPHGPHALMAAQALGLKPVEHTVAESAKNESIATP